MKRKILASLLALATAVIFLASCGGDKTGNSSLEISSQLTPSQTVTSETSSDVSLPVSSDVSSDKISSESSAPQVQSTVSVNSDIIHDEYGKQVDKTKDGSLRLFKKAEGSKNIYTVCLYDKDGDTYEKLDQSAVNASEDTGYAFFTDWWGVDSDGYFFLNDQKNTIGYYVCSTGKTGILPIDDPMMNRTVYFMTQMQDGRFVNPWGIKDRICWVETDYTWDKEVDKLYIYDPETDTKTLLYQSDGARWMDKYWVMGDKMYFKTVCIHHPGETQDNPYFHYWDPEGDLYYYDGENVTVVAENICYFKLDDGVPYIRKTENSEWEKLHKD